MENIKSQNFTIGTELMLHNLNAEEYIPMFRKYDLGGKILSDLVAEDLILMGIDSPELREKILDKCVHTAVESDTYTLANAVQVLTNTNQQLQRLNLAVVTNSLCMSKDKNPEDVLIYPNLYASDVMLQVIEKIEEKLDTISDVLTYTILKETNVLSKNRKRKRKLVIASVGSLIIASLSYYLIKSLKDL